jgi:hypothetical protein
MLPSSKAFTFRRTGSMILDYADSIQPAVGEALVLRAADVYAA